MHFAKSPAISFTLKYDSSFMIRVNSVGEWVSESSHDISLSFFMEYFVLKESGGGVRFFVTWPQNVIFQLDTHKVWVIITSWMIPLSHKNVSILHFELENSKEIFINFITRDVQAPLVAILELDSPVSFLIRCFHFSNWKFLVLFQIYSQNFIRPISGTFF